MQRNIQNSYLYKSKKKKPKEERMPCMGMINIKFNKMVILRVRRRGEIRE